MSTTFFTGFPGFLGVQLLPRLLTGTDDAARCLVEPRFVDVAERRAKALAVEHPELVGRVEIVPGDITRPDLGLEDPAAARRGVTEVQHLAAVYDLAVRRDLGMRVNVDGTRHLLDFAASCPDLERVHYTSTCYVSGRWTGIFRESDLDKGQRFNNFYEETKFLAEVEVRERAEAGLPVVVYRPAVVTGDSTTGATQKYDGPYYILRWLLRQPRIAVMPVIGDPTICRFNVVPRDYVIDAMVALIRQGGHEGQTFQLADPEPLTIREVVQAMAAACERTVVQVPVPLGLAKGALRHVPGLYGVVEIPPAAVDYFRHPTHYDTAATTAALEGTGISVPAFRSYVGHLAQFVREHPSIDVQTIG